VSVVAPMRRHGRDIGLGGLFVEREGEVATLELALATAKQGGGATIIIDAPAGNGKSRLLAVAGDMARSHGMQVLGAHASELEQEYPFGTAIQLFEPRWNSTDPRDRPALLKGPARAAGTLLGDQSSDAEPGPSEDREYELVDGLFWLASNLASVGPLVMLVDDVHWSDRASLRFLVYLAHRVADRPIVLVVALREGEPATDPQALITLMSAPTAVKLHPGPITERGVSSLVQSEFPEADDVFISACARVTHGNLLLLVELLAQIRADGRGPDSATAARLTDLVPEAIVSSVIARLGTMSSGARTLACAMSVLGDGAALPHAAQLAGLTSQAAADAADALVAVHMLRAGQPLSFVHPLVRSAVAASMSPLARAHAHGRAAVILRDDHSPAEAVAAHLLGSPPEADPAAIDILRTAAHHALVSGSAASAGRLLERALAEQPRPEARAAIVRKLAEAEAMDGLPGATERISKPINVGKSRSHHAESALAQGRALSGRSCYRQAAEVLGKALTELEIDDESFAAELEAAYVVAASLVPSLAGTVSTRRELLLGALPVAPTAAQRSAVAQLAAMASLLGDERSSVRELAELAWGSGALLDEETVDGPSWPMLTAALLLTDELERVVEICDVALADARDRESALGFATVSYCRAWPLYEQGRIVDAAADAEAALDARPSDSITKVRTAGGALASCHLQRGDLEQAEKALAMTEEEGTRGNVRHPFLLDVRAQLRLAQHRPAEALEDATRAGESLHSDFAADHPGAIAWRSTAALAHLALGQSLPGQQLAQAELERARRIGVTRIVIRDLRILGLAKGGTDGIELLTEAVRIGRRYPERLEYIYALIDLGAALRRANRRESAREPLREGLDLSRRGGATALAARAQLELTATGSRPRGVSLSGIESLTPSERRVADLGAQGLTTRQIAGSLFVTPKTVEYHLRHTYQKLHIQSRGQLAEKLAIKELG
jgi:DNA-binding CsgD family transcriptional regulator